MIPDIALLGKYNVPVPRYTSYPTVPYWQDSHDTNAWENAFKKDFSIANLGEGIALYIHLPFCEKLCTYCGCNKKITGNHGVEEDYIKALHEEWAMYLSWMGEPPVLRELHLGGGTPTFFSPANLQKLLQPILASCHIHPLHEFSFEGHPNNTTRMHLATLYELGFRRVSFGVQDNDPVVQHVINRVQPFINVVRATEAARNIGYDSVNFDLIYGLPRQTLKGMQDTINQVISLKPDRVAFYSYAHVPWTSRGQRLFDESDLPTAEEKLRLYEAGKKLFLENGYSDIGMDHFALPHDELYKAMEANTLHRNFMGYTTQHTNLMLGLGVSSISSTAGAYVQNVKTVQEYYELVLAGLPAIHKTCFLTAEDQRFGRYIREISCFGHTSFQSQDLGTIVAYCLPKLQALEADGLLTVSAEGVQVTPLGRNFIRNICSVFDRYLAQSSSGKGSPVFSRSV